ncbi:MAG: hypothetical protein AseanaTS_30700 [Candidatus Pelagadaptatus aseana]|uniref:hypothetical protein n=1 Tax=Candidatus Pelagadaptatus aseana TaxID=3120508 RepID=UPI0039B2F827
MMIFNVVYRQQCYRWFTLLLAMTCLSLPLASTYASDTANGYIPNDFNYYNPLKHGHKGNNWLTSKGLSNEELAKAAEDIRSSDMSIQQRALNHQWLQEPEGDGLHFGTKVVSRLVKMGFRTYWDGMRNKHYRDNKVVPDSAGNGKVSEDVDYKIRLSDDKVKLSVQYEF